MLLVFLHSKADFTEILHSCQETGAKGRHLVAAHSERVKRVQSFSFKAMTVSALCAGMEMQEWLHLRHLAAQP